MIGVPSFDLPKLMSVKQICLMPASCLSLINTRQDTRKFMNKLLITTQPIRNEQKRALIAGVPYPISPLPLYLSPYPLSRPATQATTIMSQLTLRKVYLSIDFFALITHKTYNFNAPTTVTPASHKIMAKMRCSMSKDTAFNGETMFALWRSQNPLRLTQWVNQSLQSSYTAKWRTSGQSLWITSTGHIARD